MTLICTKTMITRYDTHRYRVSVKFLKRIGKRSKKNRKAPATTLFLSNRQYWNIINSFLRYTQRDRFLSSSEVYNNDTIYTINYFLKVLTIVRGRYISKREAVDSRATDQPPSLLINKNKDDGFNLTNHDITKKRTYKNNAWSNEVIGEFRRLSWRNREGGGKDNKEEFLFLREWMRTYSQKNC